MKLLLDQGLPRSAAALLTAAGIDSVHVGDLGLSTAEDATILQAGLEADRTVVTLDADFHALLAMSGAIAPSVIRIRSRDCAAWRSRNCCSRSSLNAPPTSSRARR